MPHVSRYPQRLEEGIRYSGAEVTGGCGSLNIGAGKLGSHYIALASLKFAEIRPLEI